MAFSDKRFTYRGITFHEVRFQGERREECYVYVILKDLGLAPAMMTGSAFLDEHSPTREAAAERAFMMLNLHLEIRDLPPIQFKEKLNAEETIREESSPDYGIAP